MAWEVKAYLDDGEILTIDKKENVSEINPKIPEYFREGFLIESKDPTVRTYYPGRVIKKIEVIEVE